MSPLRTLIVDDEPPARRAMQVLLADRSDVAVVAAVADGLEALTVAATERIDLIFADIAMPNLSGIELVGRLAAADRPSVVFVTAHADRAIAAFDLGVVDYLLKPVAPERLDQAIRRVHARHGSVAPAWTMPAKTPPLPAHIWLDVAGGRERVRVDAIEMVRAEDDYVRVFTAERSYLVAGPLDHLVAALGPTFLRVHRSTAINVPGVTRVTSDSSRRLVLTMRSGSSVTVSRRSTGHVRDVLTSSAPRRSTAPGQP